VTVFLGRSTGLSHPGRKRRRNEDAWVLQPPLFAVADGMGGARGGEIASRVAATALGEAVDGSGEERVVALIQKANRQVFERAKEDADASGMGTTITVALVEDSMVALGHVGDSRAYLIRDHKVEQLTDDHSLVAELVRSGRLSPEEADIHPQRSVITRALGTDVDVDVDSFSVEAKADDVFLICSDGLTAMVDDEKILGIVEQARDDFDMVAKELIAAANESGGEDNITVVFFEMTDKAPEPPAETKAMPAVQPPPPPSAEADEDTLSGLERVPTVETMVVPPEQVQALAERDGPSTGTVAVQEAAPEEPPKERFSVRAARLVVALAVVAALALLVYWLLGQSR
jgi:serine/threonine protein phosphatase PrpC